MSDASTSARRARARRRFLLSEVVQTSSMDCGPAALQCLLDGFGIRASYGRLREACQTDVDGTSIDTLESVAQRLGLDAQQQLAPIAHLALAEAELLPALLVVRQAGGSTHFVVAWRRVAGRVLVMDPATGRRWPRVSELAREAYEHRLSVGASAWRNWAGSAEFQRPFARRLRDSGCARAHAQALLARADADPSWLSFAALDAAERMTRALVDSGGLARGRGSARLLEALFDAARVTPSGPAAPIPAPYWSARELAREAPRVDAERDEPRLEVRGAVLVRVRGKLAHAPHGERASDASSADAARAALSPELAAALSEPTTHPLRELGSWLAADGLVAPAVLVVCAALAAAAVLVQALLFRGLLDVSSALTLPEQRIGALGALLVFVVALALLELPLAAGVLRLGRHLELRLRLALHRKLPQLPDRYLRSRPFSDMAERAHSLVLLRGVPALGVRLVRTALQLAWTALALVWLAPDAAGGVVALAAIALLGPLLFQRSLAERELRARSHLGALGRYYLDALLGLVAARTHGAERALRREHESLLVEWTRASLRFQRCALAADALSSVAGFGLCAWLLAQQVARGAAASGSGAGGEVLLYAYWLLSVPSLGVELAQLLRQYPAQRNVALRLLEPLRAPSSDGSTAVACARAAETASALRASATADESEELAARAAEREAGAAMHAAQPHALAPLAPSPRAAGLRAAGPRALEPRALELDHDRGAESAAAAADAADARGVSIALHGVTCLASGHTLLERIDVAIEPGEHVAIVGRSGAGKSSLVGLLLGWSRPTDGALRVDGAALDAHAQAELRRATAWIDPAVQLWNRSLFSNLRYGNEQLDPRAIGAALDAAALGSALGRMPDGLETVLGEGGGLLSGGEGQRVRFARALLREHVRLAILDEPFRGLAREQRRRLLAHARAHWRHATLLCVTHDLEETLEFARVLVIEGGRLVEDGVPRVLAARADSEYARMLEAERAVRRELWQAPFWTHWRVEDGRLAVQREAIRDADRVGEHGARREARHEEDRDGAAERDA